MGIENLISEALQLPNDLIAYHVARRLAELYPQEAIVEGHDWYFDLEAYGRARKCFVVEERRVFNHVRNIWETVGKKQKQITENSWLKVLWNNQLFEIVLITWTEGNCRRRHHWIVAESREIAEAFFDAVCSFSCEVRGEIVVYRDGYFEKNQDLFQSIKGATFDNLILPESLRTALETDFVQFFESRETYERYGIAWKRGAVFIGSPGNGKTHAVKALINKLDKPCIYVRNFTASYGTEQENMAEVFGRARMTAPCIVVLEDLDAMINDQNRAFFLNELDGFHMNKGLMVLATTNHPEKLDAAILDRPSRFDRKYHFNLPGESERLAYLNHWNDELNPEMRITESIANLVVSRTEGFSFAYLKELVISSMVKWISNHHDTSMEKIVLEQADSLRGELGTVDRAQTPGSRFKLLKRAANLMTF